MLPRGAETPKSNFPCFRVARKRQKAISHASAWRGNNLKEMIKKSPANINLRGLYHSHSYAIRRNGGTFSNLQLLYTSLYRLFKAQ